MDDGVAEMSHYRDVVIDARVLRLESAGGFGAEIDRAQHGAADEVQRLVDELEQTLDARERRLLHQLRLAAESLGAVRAAFPGLARWR
jgi:hypothetical protein